jgi:mannose-1-phosphate guanylyltransferase/ActR/RegA family two-component response regulator
MADISPRPTGPVRILVAEDEPHIRRILKTLFEGTGYELRIVSDGSAALAAVRGDDPYHLVLLDLVMPEASGLDVLREIRSLEHRRPLPVIMLTAKGQDADRERALGLGANAYLTKPFSPRKLLSQIDALVVRTHSVLWAAVLAGGVGARFWPASTPARPKPLLPLASAHALIRDTVDRASTLAPPDHIRILTGEHLVPAFREALPELPMESFWVEPSARGTGPVLAWAAHRALREEPGAVIVSLHADHQIAPMEAFTSLLQEAVRIACNEDVLISVVATPDRPEPGYGYLRPGDALRSSGDVEAFRVGEFVEKPDATTAEGYVSRGYVWNTGIFVLPAARFLEEVALHSPEIGPHLPLLDEGDVAGFFAAVPTISVDEAVFERSARVGAVRATFRWDDVGGWAALARSLPGDASGNRTVGDVHVLESKDCVVWGEGGPVVLFGVQGIVAVRSGDVTLVTTKDASPRLKELLEKLPPELRSSGGGE